MRVLRIQFVLVLAVAAVLGCQRKSSQEKASGEEGKAAVSATTEVNKKEGNECDALAADMNAALESMKGQVAAAAGGQDAKKQEFDAAFAGLANDWVGACKKGLLSDKNKECIRNTKSGRVTLAQCLPEAMEAIKRYKSMPAKPMTDTGPKNTPPVPATGANPEPPKKTE